MITNQLAKPEVEGEYKKQMLEYEKQEQLYHQWMKEEQEKFLIEEQKRIDRTDLLIKGDIDIIKGELEKALELYSFPLETNTEFIILSSEVIMLDIDLPDIGDIYSKKSNILSTGKISIKDKSQKEIQTDYAKAIHGIALSLASLVFSSIPTANKVIVSGSSQRIDTKTGMEKNEYLYSIIFDKDNFYRLNIPNADPIMVFDNFENRKKITKTFELKEINPFSPEDLLLQ